MPPAQHLQVATYAEVPMFGNERAGANGVGEAGYNEEQPASCEPACEFAQRVGWLDKVKPSQLSRARLVV